MRRRLKIDDVKSTFSSGSIKNTTQIFDWNECTASNSKQWIGSKAENAWSNSKTFSATGPNSINFATVIQDRYSVVAQNNLARAFIGEETDKLDYQQVLNFR